MSRRDPGEHRLSVAWRSGRRCGIPAERKTGFEPATLSLATRCATTAPLPRGEPNASIGESGRAAALALTVCGGRVRPCGSARVLVRAQASPDPTFWLADVPLVSSAGRATCRGACAHAGRQKTSSASLVGDAVRPADRQRGRVIHTGPVQDGPLSRRLHPIQCVQYQWPQHDDEAISRRGRRVRRVLPTDRGDVPGAHCSSQRRGYGRLAASLGSAQRSAPRDQAGRPISSRSTEPGGTAWCASRLTSPLAGRRR